MNRLIIPPDGRNVRYVFGMDADRNIVLRREGIDVDPPIGPLNIGALPRDNMIRRYSCDIVKDSQTETKVTEVLDKMRACFADTLGGVPTDDGGPYIPRNIAAYKQQLHDLEQIVSDTYRGNITVLKSILKTSTEGSNIQISDAEYALWESGFGCRSICRKQNLKTVKTSAATLDSLLKQAYDKLFNPYVTFDDTFSNGLGIPGGLTWSTQPEPLDSQNSIVRIQYWTPPAAPPAAAAAAVVEGLINNEANTPAARGVFNGIGPGNNGEIKGNDLKNDEINGLAANLHLNCPRIKKLFIIKEIGDVAQVWMYLALIELMGWERTDVVMVTTDSVVYLFCILLKLSCIYTGERSGVRPGCCTLKHYLGGEPDYLQKYKNMIEVHANRIMQHNNSIAMGLKILVQDPSMFDYYIPHGLGYRRTIASKGLTSVIQSTSVNPMIRGFISIIEAVNKHITLALDLVKTSIEVAAAPAGQARVAAQTAAAAAAAAEAAAAAAAAGGALPQEAQPAAAAAAAALASLQTATAQLGVVLQNANAVARAAINQEATITAGYNHFCTVVDPLKQANMLTLLPNKRYIMLPGQLLTQFVNFTNPHVTPIDNVSRIIAGEEAAANAERQFARALRGGGGQRGGANKKYKRTNSPPPPPPPPPLVEDERTESIAAEDTSTFYECLVACYIQATRDTYNDLHERHDNETLNSNPVCSINSFDNMIQLNSVRFGNPFNFNALYDRQLELGPDMDNQADQRWRVNDTYGDNNYELQIAFALDYDNFANALIREQNVDFVNQIHGVDQTPNRRLLQNYVDSLYPTVENPNINISESQIIKRGKRLLRFLHLAEDRTDEDSSLKSTMNERMKIFPPSDYLNIDTSIYPNPVGGNDWTIDTRFHSWLLRNSRGPAASIDRAQVPLFNPSTLCGRKRDPINYSLIDPALAIEIAVNTPRGVVRKCYQITTIVYYLMNNPNITLDTLQDLSTTADILPENKQNIANFIIMMYQLTPIVQNKLGGFFGQSVVGWYNLYIDPPAIAGAAAIAGAGAAAIAPAGAGAGAAAIAPAGAGAAAIAGAGAGAGAGVGVKRGWWKIRRGGGSKRKTIKYMTKYKNKSNNYKRVNKHRITRRKRTTTRRPILKHRD
jgi:hypothetical protein